MIEMYWLDENQVKKVIYTIQIDEFKQLNPSLDKLKMKTGIYIDPYGTTRVSPEHLKLLISDLTSKKSVILKNLKFMNILNEALIQNKWIIFEGD